MLLDILMLVVYIILNIFAIWQTNRWFNRSFGVSTKAKRTLNIITGILFVALSSTIMLWIPLPVNGFSIAIIRTGNCWLGFLIEFLFVVLIADLIFLAARAIMRKKASQFPAVFHRMYGLVVLIVSIALTVGGSMNARTININTYDITVNKKAAVKDLKVALIADMHMGYSIGCSQIQKMVDKINKMEPDVVLLAGDMFDNNYDALEDPEKLESIYRQIKSKYGVYAVYGNHDVSATLVGGFTVGGSRRRDPRTEQFLKNSNITMLLDDTVTIADNSIYLIGRVDEEQSGDGRQRKTLEELTKNLDQTKPLFVINHEPTKLESYAENNVDVLFSGHTHDGQTFPLNLLMPIVWKNAHGCIKVKEMYSLVTSGIGVYGPYMRTFSQAEIMEVNVHFQ